MTEVPPALFRDFAELEARGVSPLYERLSRYVAGRPPLRRLLGAAPPRQRRATLFFAAIHDVVLERGVEYPDDGPALEAFCAANLAAITRRISTRRTQTNEVARSAQLVPALSVVADRAGQPPSVLEIGASAGLNLRFDAYRYTYRTAFQTVCLGEAADPVNIEVEFDGDAAAIPAALPVVAERIGLDAEPVDLADPHQRRWLRACIWADEPDRDGRLQAAMARARSDPPRVLRGDAIEHLEAAAAHLRADMPLVIIHQVVMGYLSTRARTQFRRKVLDLGRHRRVYWLFAESPTAAETLAGIAPPSWTGHVQHSLVLVDLTGGRVAAEQLAFADPHGRWLRWVAAPVS